MLDVAGGDVARAAVQGGVGAGHRPGGDGPGGRRGRGGDGRRGLGGAGRPGGGGRRERVLAGGRGGLQEQLAAGPGRSRGARQHHDEGHDGGHGDRARGDHRHRTPPPPAGRRPVPGRGRLLRARQRAAGRAGGP
ncbi:hypothetical protein EF918_36170, partial [Streptomyces sp. WAC06614]